MMTKKSVNILIFVLWLLPIILILIDSPSLQANAELFDNISQIKIRQENGSIFSIGPNYFRDFDPPRLLKNIDLAEKNMTVHKNETITISYQSPCGIPESIKGMFLDGKIFEVGIGNNQKLNLEGNQTEFYENDLPRRNGTDLANIPTDLKTGNYKLVMIIDCDDTINYYISNATVK